MKKLCFAFLFLILVGTTPLCLYQLNDRFCLGHIQSSLSYDPQWDIPLAEKQEINSLLDQPFFYLGKGSQCFVFESHDHQTVLKFFRFERLRILPWIRSLTLPPFLKTIQNKRLAEKENKKQRLFTSCQIAYEELKEECGLLCVHLNPNSCFEKKIAIKDKLGRTYWIEIDRTAFILQRKGTLIYPTLEKWMKEGNLEKAQQGLKDIVALLERRFQKGIVDRDPVLKKNAGFLQEHPIYLDIGEFARDETVKDPAFYSKEIARMTSQLRRWIEGNYPELIVYLDEEINNLSGAL